MGIFGDITIESESPDEIKRRLNEAGWLPETIEAAGQLRQGKAPTLSQMLTGAALIEVLRPRRSKLLPRHFVLAVTPDRVVAFKAKGGSGERGGPYKIYVDKEVAGSWPREHVRITDLPEGPESKGGIMHLTPDTGDAETFPVSRPNLTGEQSTNELIATLSG